MVSMPDNLPELRDIHLPEGVSLWPIGYGWWIILITISATLILLKTWSYLRRKSKKLYALRQLKKSAGKNSVKTAAAISEILRRICMYKYPQAVSLSGDEWIKFLTKQGKFNLEDNVKEVLLNAPYMPDDSPDFDSNDMVKLYEFCKSWIGENL